MSVRGAYHICLTDVCSLKIEQRYRRINCQLIEENDNTYSVIVGRDNNVANSLLAS